ncbi:MAG: hypothetical protein QXO97_05100 [Candidatus Nezhaarchaeales archaeon]
MIRTGRIVVIGDEILALVASAAGIESYTFKGNCSELYNWLTNNVPSYDVIIYLDDVADKCTKIKKILAEYAKEKMVMELEHPLKKEFVDPKKLYKEFACRVLGFEVEL